MRIALNISYEIRRGDRAYKKSSTEHKPEFLPLPQSMIGIRNANQRCVQFIQYFGSDLLVIIILTLCV